MAIVWLNPLDGANPFIRWHRSMSEGPCYSICLPRDAVAPLPSYILKVVEVCRLQARAAGGARLGHGALAIETGVSIQRHGISRHLVLGALGRRSAGCEPEQANLLLHPSEINRRQFSAPATILVTPQERFRSIPNLPPLRWRSICSTPNVE